MTVDEVDLRVPVLIVGAGPAGLTTSNLLSRYGVRHLLVEKHPGTAHTPRAHIVNQRTVEIFRHLGIEERLLAVATPGEQMANNVWHTSLSGRELARIWAWGTGPDRSADYRAASPSPMANAPQTRLEPVLLDAAREHAEADLRFGHELISYTQDADGVSALVRERASGDTYRVRCAYLVGADGARSRVVEQAGLPIEGESGLGGAVNVWFEADLSRYLAYRPGVLYWHAAPGTPFLTGAGTLICHKPWTEFVMVIAYDPATETVPHTEKFAVARIRQIVGDDTINPKIKGFSTWTINHQVAARYQDRRVFAMGDAVHRHPPTNGAGLNTSIADAFNLAWKLALVIHGRAGAGLLDTYTQERQPVGRMVVDRAMRSATEMAQVHLALGFSPGQSEEEGRAALRGLDEPGPEGEARRAELRAALELMNYQFNAHGFELGYRYREGAVVSDGSPEPEPTRDPELYYHPTTWPGASLPHAWVDRDRRRVSTLDLVEGTRFTLLTGIGGEGWTEAAAAAAHATGAAVDVHAIGTPGGPVDDYGDWAAQREIGASGAILVRPDRHIAWRAQEWTPQAAQTLTAVLRELLSLPDPQLSAPLWTPDQATRDAARLTAFLGWLRSERGLELPEYGDLWAWSVADPAGFWDALREFFEVRFAKPADAVLGDGAMPGAVWFPGAQLNFAGYLLEVERAEPAIVSVHEDGSSQEWSGARLRREVAAFAAHLREHGVQAGDRVVGYLPNVPEAVVAFLAAASLGAVWAVCGPEFGTASAVARFAQLEPVVLVASTGYRYGGRQHDRTDAVEEIRAAIPSLRETVLVGPAAAVASACTTWERATAADAELSITPVAFDHPLWVLFSSGTTGTPKGIVHGHGGILLEHLKFVGLQLDVRPGDRFFWYTSTSWMMWNVTVSALLTGATTVLYDGNPTYPGQDQLWRIVADHRVTVFGTSAAYLHGCLKADLSPARDHDLAALRALHSTGSPLSADGFRWAHERVGPHVPLFSASGGTDVASGFVGGNPLLPVWVGELSGPYLGVDVQAWSDDGRPLVGQVGELVVTAPMPSMPLYFWGDAENARYRASYFDTFPGVWRHGDWIEFTARRSAVIHGRSDSTLNRMGVRMGTAEIYRAVEALPEVAEALAIGVEAPDGGYWLPLFVALRHGHTLDDTLRGRITAAIRRDASPRHVPDDVIAVPGIPHTITGKKLEVPVKRLLLGLAAGVDRDATDRPELLDLYATFHRGGSDDAPKQH